MTALTPADLDNLTALHEPAEQSKLEEQFDLIFCKTCDTDWPCAVPALVAALQEARLLIQAISECHDDPAAAIIRADRIAGEAVIKAHSAERERDEARALVAAVTALADDAADSSCVHVNTLWGDLRAALTTPTESETP